MIINDKIIEKIKKIPIEEVLYTVKFRRVGNKLVARCPVHNEKVGSFYVYLKSNTYFCFGGCYDGGDVIYLVEKLCDVSFKDACKYLLKYL